MSGMLHHLFTIYYYSFVNILSSITSYYYQYLTTRLSAMKICFHYLLHVADSIQNTSPCWATWQFPMERLCGMLQPLAKSRLHPYKNLTNNVYLLELFNNLHFYKEIHKQIFPPLPHKEYKEHLVYTNQYYDEELQWPSKPYNLNISEVKKIKDHFSTTENIAGMRLSVCILSFISYMFKIK